MAETIKVSEMSEATDINNEDIIMIIQNGENKKAQISKINKELGEYVKNTQYASFGKSGVIKIPSEEGFYVTEDGFIMPLFYSYEEYEKFNNWMMISKGTLENVIKGKELINQTYIDNQLINKVDKEEGKSLSSNDFTNEMKEKLDKLDLSNYTTKDYVDTQIQNKITEVLEESY